MTVRSRPPPLSMWVSCSSPSRTRWMLRPCYSVTSKETTQIPTLALASFRETRTTVTPTPVRMSAAAPTMALVTPVSAHLVSAEVTASQKLTSASPTHARTELARTLPGATSACVTPDSLVTSVTSTSMSARRSLARTEVVALMERTSSAARVPLVMREVCVRMKWTTVNPTRVNEARVSATQQDMCVCVHQASQEHSVIKSLTTVHSIHVCRDPARAQLVATSAPANQDGLELTVISPSASVPVTLV